jgi:hypothetical protein
VAATTPNARTIGISLSRDLLAGLVLIAFAAAMLWFGRTLPAGSSQRMGSGYMPNLVAGLICLLGIVVAVGSVSRPSPRIAFRLSIPLLLVVGAVIGFALLIEPLGLAASAFLLVVAVSFATPDRHWLSTLVTAGLLAAFVVILFVAVLGLRIKVFPF